MYYFDVMLIHSDLVMSFREAMAKAGAGAGHRCGFQRALAKAVGAAAVDLGYLALSPKQWAFLKTSFKIHFSFKTF